MRARSLIGIGLLLFALFLIGNTPAWILSDALARFAPNTLTLQRAQGSLWRGRADVQARLPQGGMLDLGGVEWHLQPAALLTGKLAVHLDAPSLPQGGSVRTGVAVGFDRVPQLKDLQAQLPASLLAQLAPQLRMLQADGNIELASDAFVLSPTAPSGKLAATWRGFATRMSKINPLGDYQLNAQFGAGPINFKLAAPKGPLLIEGSGSWSAATRLNFDGNARLAPGAAPELANLVRLFGRDQGGGVYAISLKNF